MAIEDAVPALRAAMAASKDWPGWGTDPLLAGQASVVIISELRQIAGDPGFMSPTPTDSISIHFTFGHHPSEVMGCVKEIGGSRNDRPWHFAPGSWNFADRLRIAEAALAPFNARPHWGKLYTPDYMTKERVARLYPEVPKFVELCRAHDPEGKFRNEYLEQMIDF